MRQLSITETRKNLTSLVHLLSTSESEPPNTSTPPPSSIEVRGKKAAVLLSNKEYERMKRQILDQEIDSIFQNFHEANVALANR